MSAKYKIMTSEILSGNDIIPALKGTLCNRFFFSDTFIYFSLLYIVIFTLLDFECLFM